MNTLRILQLWMPFAFSICLSGIVMVSTIFSKDSLPPGFIPFVCFMPMTFFFVAQSTLTYVSTLEKRVAALEARLASSEPSATSLQP